MDHVSFLIWTVSNLIKLIVRTLRTPILIYSLIMVIFTISNKATIKQLPFWLVKQMFPSHKVEKSRGTVGSEDLMTPAWDPINHGQSISW